MDLLEKPTPGIVRRKNVTSLQRPEGGDLQALRGQNRAAVLAQLYEHPEGASMSEIHVGTSLSRPTVKVALADLMKAGLVTEAPLGSSTARGGRPGRRFWLDPNIGVIGGALIGLERVEIALADLYGNVLCRGELRRDPAIPVRQQLTTILQNLLGTPDLPSPNLRTLTIGVIGIVSPTGQMRPNESFVEISQDGYFSEIEKTFDCDILIDNDANLAATAEFANLNRPEVRDMIGLHADVAVGCGLILDSKLHRGHAGAAGEMGFYRASGWHSSHKALQEVAAEHDITVAELFDQAGAEVPFAKTAVSDFAKMVAPGVLAIVLTVNPQVIVIGGAICGAKDAFRQPLTDFIAADSPAPPEIVFSALGRDCITLGALHRSLSAVWDQLQALAYTEMS